MKKLFSILLSAVLLVGLAGCSSSRQGPTTPVLIPAPAPAAMGILK